MFPDKLCKLFVVGLKKILIKKSIEPVEKVQTC